MEIGTISNIYLLIFIPFIASLSCQIFQFKNAGFSITLASILSIFALTVKIFPDILIYEKVKNDYDLSLLSIALEFSLDLVGIVFLFIILFLEFIILIFYRRDIEKMLTNKNYAFFYSVFLLNLFGLIGIFTTNNLFNLYIFIEIYSFAFFSITTISYNKKLLNISFKNFCLSSASSILILICFFAIYLTFGELNFDKIADNIFLLPKDNIWFLLLIFLLFFLAIIVKFFPLWQYFEKLKSTSLVASFLIIDAFFVKILVGLFLVIKFIYFFFGSNFLFTQYKFSTIIMLIGLLIVMFSSFKIIAEKHLKLICIYFVISNIGFMISAIGLQSIESMQSMFFFMLNFAITNFFIFLFASFVKTNFQTSSLNKMARELQISEAISLPLKLIIPFVIGLPFTLLFFAYWHLALAILDYNLKIIMLLALIVSSFSQLNVAIKIIDAFIFKTNLPDISSKSSKLFIKENFSQILCFWLIIFVIFIIALLSESFNNLSLRFATFLLSNSI